MADLPVFCVRKPEENYSRVGSCPQKRAKANCDETSVVRAKFRMSIGGYGFLSVAHASFKQAFEKRSRKLSQNDGAQHQAAA